MPDLLVAVLLQKVGEPRHGNAGRNGARFRCGDQFGRPAAGNLVELGQERGEVGQAEIADVRFQRITQAGVPALECARIEVDVVVVDVPNQAGRTNPRGLVDRRLIVAECVRPLTHDGRVGAEAPAVAGAVFQARQQVKHRVVFLAQQSDRIFLLD